LCNASHRLHEYSLETGLATVIDGNDILKVSTEHLKDLKFQVGSVYQFIGELLIRTDDEVRACQGLAKALAYPIFYSKLTWIHDILL
jgi:undecaprenyl pyrophosphate synthase